MTPAECSHCWQKGHRNQRECPNKHRPHAELAAEFMREINAREERITRIAEAIAACSVEERVECTRRAFKEAAAASRVKVYAAILDRDVLDEATVEQALRVQAVPTPKTTKRKIKRGK